jgi:hypothetical protein
MREKIPGERHIRNKWVYSRFKIIGSNNVMILGKPNDGTTKYSVAGTI